MSDESHLLEHKELVALLLQKHDIHNGIWGVYIEFKFVGLNMGPPGEVLPAAVTAISRIGIQRFQEESNIAFDAAILNPEKSARKAVSKKGRLPGTGDRK